MFGSADLLTIFTTGLLTGGLTCMAVQGGLLAATMAQKEEERLQKKAKDGRALPLFSFLIAKLAAYTLFGFLLGWLGSFLTLSVQARVLMQVLVVIFMIGTALNMLNVHPVFRYFVIQPPKFLTRLVRKQSKKSDLFSPAILGAFTVFIPCGTTQAMMALSIASGSPLAGALILFAFVLGTTPVFFLLGYFTMVLGDVLKERFMKVAALAIIILSLFNLDSALTLSGSQFTFRNTFKEAFCLISYCDTRSVAGASSVSPVKEQTIEITSGGYSPERFAVKAGSTVTLHISNRGALGCVQAFTIPSLNVQKIVSPGGTEDIIFKAPEKPGTISFSCSMGMYPGTIEVI